MAELSIFESSQFSDAFWNGLKDHFPVLNYKLAEKDYFVIHICHSL